jgi:hypothetical protein
MNRSLSFGLLWLLLFLLILFSAMFLFGWLTVEKQAEPFVVLINDFSLKPLRVPTATFWRLNEKRKPFAAHNRLRDSQPSHAPARLARLEEILLDIL